ncbi:lysophospholipid acyltransferase family protein [Clostridium fallax]|uniref:1-acyl-sn-glycerol-3-phosphate acyltransferase n=1 Tax=Clostridium fallax TaxID=1533 RepID=A0A1M4YYB3_9CLOT|nr:lysophospholipid acyltransferase family protein [Clostridium fallax]SHF10819.1 1-acyl-sn-glycerol-3-phosphate acyltransferase [Clostridium fallax]SQB07386.1 1-acyl-sn-glycerol-3-phosphate acyltransferase [Clostridium fallax]
MIIQGIKGIIAKIILKYCGEEKGREYINKQFLSWARWNNKLLGLSIDIKGKENIPKGVCVFISNHQSILDIPIMVEASNRPIGFIAKKELIKIPVLGQWMKLVHCVTLDRQNVREAIKVINDGVENLKKGYSMGIFPEGTRAKDGIIKPFKKGSLKLATKAKVPIVPVTIDGAYKAFEIDGKFKKANITITFSKPIFTENLSREEEIELPKIIENTIRTNLKK